jgi:uncharacterized protein (TIGR00730 family)
MQYNIAKPSQFKEGKLKNICVFCGSNSGNHPEYLQAASRLGQTLARRDITLIYGGGNIGMMGALADSVLQSGGMVTGVITQKLLDLEVAHPNLTELIIVETMHQRKSIMSDLAGGFVALPGGFGTLEEIFEVLTWGQLGIHHKPCGLLNVNGYFDNLIHFLKNTVQEKFVTAEHFSMLMVEQDPDALLEKFFAYSPPSGSKLLPIQ